MKKKYIAVLDTETCPIEPQENVSANNMLVYDIGYSIVDLYGKVLAEKSFIVAEIFFGEMEKMKSAYYYDKVGQYYLDIANGSRKVKTWQEIRREMYYDFKKYKVQIVAAHNAYFDFTSLKTTKNYLGEKQLIPYGIEWWDTMKMFKSCYGGTKKYIDFCSNNGFMTNQKPPRVQLKAETIYRFISNDLTFEEKHTGLEDTKIEREILWHCVKSHKKLDRLLWRANVE